MISETVTLTTPLDGADDWVVANTRQKGYYRVNYDLNNWRAIQRQLLKDHTVL